MTNSLRVVSVVMSGLAQQFSARFTWYVQSSHFNRLTSQCKQVGGENKMHFRYPISNVHCYI